MRHIPTEKQVNRMRVDQEELADRIATALPQDGAIEVQPGLHYRRHSRPTEPVYASAQPSFCVIAQGSKDITLGEDTFRYDPAHYLISTMELPLSGKVVEATPERPYLSFRLVLDPSVVTSVMVESGIVQPMGDSNVNAVDVSLLNVDLLDATVRLVRLTEKPNEFRILAALVMREITYRLLIGAQCNRMRHLAKFGGQAHRMARAVEIIRNNFDKPLRIDGLARTYHERFGIPCPFQNSNWNESVAVPKANQTSRSQTVNAQRRP